MKKNFFCSFTLFIWFSIVLPEKSLAQCSPCDIPSRRVTQEEIVRFTGNYNGNFRNSDKKHSICVDFSSESIITFYDTNFGAGSTYTGTNIHLISLGRRDRPGQSDKDQIGLVISATDGNCKSQVDKYMIRNNTFDQTPASYIPPAGTLICLKTELEDYKENYNNSFSERHHSRHIFFTKDVLYKLYKVLKDNPNIFDGLRFSFASYNKPKQACKQKTRKQITVLISPIFKDGSANIDKFHEFLKTKYKASDVENLTETLNHGTLCPTACPDDGR